MLFGFTLFQFFSAASTHLGVIANVVGVVIGLAGTIFATTNVRPLWQKLVVGWPTRKTSETTDPPARGLTDSYLETLLLTPLSEAGVAQVERHVQGVSRIVLLTTVGIFVITASAVAVSLAATGVLGSSQTNSTDGTAEDASSDGLATTLTLIAGVVTLVIYAPLVGVQNASVGFTKQLACTVTKDMADQITAQIRRSTASTLDFDEITSRTFRLHLSVHFPQAILCRVIWFQTLVDLTDCCLCWQRDGAVELSPERAADWQCRLPLRDHDHLPAHRHRASPGPRLPLGLGRERIFR